MKTAALYFTVFVIACLVGCANGARRVHAVAPAAVITGAGASLTQNGEAQTPAAADTTAGRSALTIPAGTPVSIAPDGVATFTAALPISLTSSFDRFRATGPAAFTPPAPPTPADEARAAGVRYFYFAALVCLVGSGLAAWAGYPLAALCLGVAVPALPVMANVVSSSAGVLVGGVLLALAAGLVIAHHLTHRALTAAVVSLPGAIDRAAAPA